MASSTASLKATGPLAPLSAKIGSENRKKGIVLLPRSDITAPRLRCQAFQSCSTYWRCCSAALNTRCAAEQTQTVTRQSSTITIAPTQGKEKSPKLDDGGTGSPPRDDGGGGGGGGGSSSSGGFFLFALLLFLGYLREKENGDDMDPRRRYNRIY